MRGRKPEKFQLKPTDEAYLRKLLRDGETPWRIARRAQILLQRADKEQRIGFLSETLVRFRNEKQHLYKLIEDRQPLNG